MQLCKNCWIPMVSVMSFSKDKHEKFCRCPKCLGETKHTKINDSELDFGEVLHKKISERKRKYANLSPEQLALLDKYCRDDLRELKKICLPLITMKGVADMETDDLISDAMNVLLETVANYDCSRNDNFGAYLTTNIKRSYKDWTRDRMRDKRINYARDKNGDIIFEEYNEGGKKKKRKVLIKPIPLDAATEEGREIYEKVESNFRVENIFMKTEWHQEVIDYLSNLSPLQRKIIIMIANKYNKDEICGILHIESPHYDNLLKRITSDEKIKPLTALI